MSIRVTRQTFFVSIGICNNSCKNQIENFPGIVRIYPRSFPSHREPINQPPPGSFLLPGEYEKQNPDTTDLPFLESIFYKRKFVDSP